jgi:raffinose/stachyose/melibiose transport system substrate-binding protein
MDFPVPASDDPEFGVISEGPVYERPSSSFSFVITRTCKHPEAALDFLRFLGSQRGNEEFNRIIGWIPAVMGTRVSPMLEPFNPHLEGIFGCMPVTLGGETSIKWQQLYSLFQVNQINYAEMVAEFLPFYLAHGVREWEELNRNRWRGMARDEQLLAGVRALAESAAPAQAQSRWVKYRQMAATRLLTRDLNAALLQQQLDEGVATNTAGPFEFSPELIAKVRTRLRADVGQ